MFKMGLYLDNGLIVAILSNVIYSRHEEDLFHSFAKALKNISLLFPAVSFDSLEYLAILATEIKVEVSSVLGLWSSSAEQRSEFAQRRAHSLTLSRCQHFYPSPNCNHVMRGRRGGGRRREVEDKPSR